MGGSGKAWTSWPYVSEAPQKKPLGQLPPPPRPVLCPSPPMVQLTGPLNRTPNQQQGPAQQGGSPSPQGVGKGPGGSLGWRGVHSHHEDGFAPQELPLGWGAWGSPA